ncbi:MAG: hypothetical protein RSC93_05060 [Erysipelotrichaceae bacterium]
MNIELKKFISNFSLTLLANIVSMIVSALVILIVPAFIDIKEYGYWQLYVFFCSYTAYFSLGLTDGAYIRNGGKNYKKINKNLLRPQFWMLFFLNVLTTIPITIVFTLFYQDINKSMAVFLACISAIILIPRSLLTMIMLTTNRIKENTIIIIIDRCIYFVIIGLCLLFGVKRFYFIIFAELIAQLISTIVATFYCKELVIGSIKNHLSEAFTDAKINVQVGIKIVLASLASILVIGIIRFGIENHWGVEVFAKVSLTLSLCNLLLTFIKSISIVIFPTLCNLSNDELKKCYINIQNLLAILLLGSLILYYPAKMILSEWIPKYGESLRYMALLFPISLFESKSQLLLNTYFKVLRKEKSMLYINLFSLCMSFLSIAFATYVLNSLDFAILSIVIVLGIRTILSELYLTFVLKIDMNKEIALDCISCLIFIYFSWYVGGAFGMIMYIIWYIFYIFYYKREYVEALIIKIDSILNEKFGDNR